MSRYMWMRFMGLVLAVLVPAMAGLAQAQDQSTQDQGEAQLLRDQVEHYRLEAEKWRLEYETLRLEHELLRIELEKCRGGMAAAEGQANATEAAEDPGAPYVAAAMAACDLAWADALLSETPFACADVRVEIPAEVELSIASAGGDDGVDGCMVRAASEAWNATSEQVWMP